MAAGSPLQPTTPANYTTSDVSESKNLALVETDVRDQLLNELLAWQ